MLKYLYTAFLGIALALFIGLGIAAFYTEPTYPNNSYPVCSEKMTASENQAANDKYQKIQDEYMSKEQAYSKVVSSICLVYALILLIVGMVYVHKLAEIADGIVLGGIFSILYGLGRGIGSADPKFIFGLVTVVLVVACYLGYAKFIKNKPKSV